MNRTTSQHTSANPDRYSNRAAAERRGHQTHSFTRYPSKARFQSNKNLMERRGTCHHVPANNPQCDIHRCQHRTVNVKNPQKSNRSEPPTRQHVDTSANTELHERRTRFVITAQEGALDNTASRPCEKHLKRTPVKHEDTSVSISGHKSEDNVQ